MSLPCSLLRVRLVHALDCRFCEAPRCCRFGATVFGGRLPNTCLGPAVRLLCGAPFTPPFDATVFGGRVPSGVAVVDSCSLRRYRVDASCLFWWASLCIWQLHLIFHFDDNVDVTVFRRLLRRRVSRTPPAARQLEPWTSSSRPTQGQHGPRTRRPRPLAKPKPPPEAAAATKTVTAMAMSSRSTAVDGAARAAAAAPRRASRRRRRRRRKGRRIRRVKAATAAAMVVSPAGGRKMPRGGSRMRLAVVAMAKTERVVKFSYKTETEIMISTPRGPGWRWKWRWRT